MNIEFKRTFYELLKHIKFRWSAFGLYSIASLLSVSLRLTNFEMNLKYVLASLGIGAIVTSITLSAFFFGFKLIPKLGNNLIGATYFPLILVMAVGAVRGVVLNLVITAFGFENHLSTFTSMLSSLVYTSIYYGGSCIFIGLILDGNDQFNVAFKSAATFRVISTNHSNPNSAEMTYEMTIKEVDRAISAHLPKYQTQEPTREQILRVASEIQSQIETVIRPLSHRLWIDSMGRIRTGKPSRIILDSAIAMGFSTWFLTAYQFIIGIFGIGLSIGVQAGVIKSLAATTTMLGITFIFRRFIRQRFQPSLFSSLFFLTSILIFPVFASEVISRSLGITVNILQAIIIAPALPTMMLVSSIYKTVSGDKRFAVAAAKAIASAESETTNSETALFDHRRLSGYLHNSLQSELLRIAKQLEKVAKSEDSFQPDEHLEELSSALQRSSTDVAQLNRAGIEELRGICNSWSGIAEIDFRIDQEKSVNEEKCEKIIECVQELITNSIRHGEANRIEINLKQIGEFFEIKLTHNGGGKIINSTGLGTRFMQGHSQVNALISRKKGLTQITLTL